LSSTTEKADSRRYLNTAEAADYLGISKGTLYNLMSAGNIPLVRIGARRIRFDRADLDRWMERHKERGATVP
jgi:excisionase family DNA binding protein